VTIYAEKSVVRCTFLAWSGLLLAALCAGIAAPKRAAHVAPRDFGHRLV